MNSISPPRGSLHGAALVFALLLSCAVPPTADGPATAQRAIFSTDAGTTPPGLVEVEVGGVWEPDAHFDSPVGVNYGAGPRTELSLGVSPISYEVLDGEDDSHPSDVSLSLRHGVAEGADGSWLAAIQGTLNVPAIKRANSLTTGEPSGSIAGVLTHSIDEWTLSGFASLELLGSPAGGADVGSGVAVLVAAPMLGRFGAYGEVYGLFVPELDHEEVITTLAITHDQGGGLVLDAGVAIGLTEDASDLHLVFGLTKTVSRGGASP